MTYRRTNGQSEINIRTHSKSGRQYQNIETKRILKLKNLHERNLKKNHARISPLPPQKLKIYEIYIIKISQICLAPPPPPSPTNTIILRTPPLPQINFLDPRMKYINNLCILEVCASLFNAYLKLDNKNLKVGLKPSIHIL